MKLDGKRVLVTGGSSGIGLKIAKALLAKGAKVAISGRRSASVSSALAELRGAKGEAVGIIADVGTAEGRTETLGRALAALGGLDILSTTPPAFARGGWRSRLRLRSRRC